MSSPPPPQHDGDDLEGFSLPVEIEVYIQPDGSVVFADLEEGTIPIVDELDPDHNAPDDSPTEGDTTHNEA
jgi:hypothetical protein